MATWPSFFQLLRRAGAGLVEGGVVGEGDGDFAGVGEFDDETVAGEAEADGAGFRVVGVGRSHARCHAHWTE